MTRPTYPSTCSDQDWYGWRAMERTTRNMILAVTTLSGFIATFAASSVNLALPSIGEYFQASAVILAWIVLAFVMAAGAVIMPVGRAADFLGHMRVFLVGMAAFTVLSFASAVAPSVARLWPFGRFTAWRPRCSSRRISLW